MALKLNVRKTYDIVECPFLEQVLSCHGFPSRFIRLILLCVSFVSYAFIFGERQFGTVVPSRGAKAFSSLLQSAEHEGCIPGVSICRGTPNISHLLFADDTLIFSGASPTISGTILDILEIYRRASGQDINFAKSSITFTRNMKEGVHRHIANSLEWLLNLVGQYGSQRLTGFHGQAVFVYMKEFDGGFALIPHRVWVASGVRVFRAKIPSKIKGFTWKAYLSALPTSTNLLKRMPRTSSACPHCKVDREDIIHVWSLVPTRDRMRIHPSPPGHSGSGSWEGPPSDSMKLNFDSALLDGEVEVGLGVVAYDQRVLISKLQAGVRDFSFISNVVLDIRGLVALFSSCHFVCVKRTLNSIAHCLAKSVIGLYEGVSDLPPAARSIVNSELIS
ncbi:hypothetical protein Sango_0228400 [Sesamum angolense]|uniref:Reverse transcriptase domain-containing protein n=1 Tax=Sesamum angolense TaxID=2727404 RepID=A0AAE1XHJ8_9LAMI|nr:hypothetical protein Sango_0228400 [Sesamum angolense]